MFGKENNKPQNRIDSLIGAGTVIEGNITYSGGLRIDGEVRGNIAAAGEQPAMLVISEQASVEGEIHVHHVMVNGQVKGPIHADQTLELQPKANVIGDVHYQKIEMQMGAVVQGRLVYEANNQSDKVVKLKPAAAE
jgi:cytoskeletal protein CcmA (bactofilin family)